MKELLLLLCRYPFDPVNKDRLRELLNKVEDWSKTVELINAHGIIALAAYNIKEAGLEKEIPGDAMAYLENGQRQSMVRNLWLTERWKEVNTILNNAGIKHILLKGMALEHTLYDSKGLRQMNDNDILIKRDEAYKAWQLLQQNGFELTTAKSAIHKKILLDIDNHLPVLYKEQYAVEIHIRLFDSRTNSTIDYNKLFDDSIEIMIDNIKAYILPQEIHVRYLMKHFERHARAGECQLRLFSDIILLDIAGNFKFSDQFLFNPFQSNNPVFRKAAYKAKVNSVTKGYRVRYILGDLFPSLKWMKERYKCNGIIVLFYYLHRFGKLVWLMKWNVRSKV
jgi:hypothetical protein